MPFKLTDELATHNVPLLQIASTFYDSLSRKNVTIVRRKANRTNTKITVAYRKSMNYFSC